MIDTDRLATDSPFWVGFSQACWDSRSSSSHDSLATAFLPIAYGQPYVTKWYTCTSNPTIYSSRNISMIIMIEVMYSCTTNLKLCVVRQKLTERQFIEILVTFYQWVVGFDRLKKHRLCRVTTLNCGEIVNHSIQQQRNYATEILPSWMIQSIQSNSSHSPHHHRRDHRLEVVFSRRKTSGNERSRVNERNDWEKINPTIDHPSNQPASQPAKQPTDQSTNSSFNATQWWHTSVVSGNMELHARPSAWNLLELF